VRKDFLGEKMESLSFEEAFEQLEASITALQEGKVPLEQALQQYQNGMQLAQYCNELLQRAELSVQQLNVNEGSDTLSVSPLDL
jgi:exodeoxyribonuclease VII small subunit